MAVVQSERIKELLGFWVVLTGRSVGAGLLHGLLEVPHPTTGEGVAPFEAHCHGPDSRRASAAGPRPIARQAIVLHNRREWTSPREGALQPFRLELRGKWGDG